LTVFNYPQKSLQWQLQAKGIQEEQDEEGGYASESNTKRYSDGYTDGGHQAATDSTYNVACDPSGAHTSDGQHTTTYCSGWANGYTATWNSLHGQAGQLSTQTQQQDQKQTQAVHTCIALKCEIIQSGNQGQDQGSNQGSTGGGQ
jgi:hypothetical protein